jgi:hypothetical protein
MSTAMPAVRRLRLGPRSAGMLLTTAEFDRARFRRTLTVFSFGGESDQVLVIPETQNYESPLLPGFEIPLARLLKLADRWAKKRR